MDPNNNKVDRDIADNLHAHTDNEVTPQLLVFFGRMETKLDHIMAWLDKHEVEADALRDRIVELEKINARNIGVAAGISFVVSTIVGVLSYALTLGGPK